MKYSKPLITSIESASLAIMGGKEISEVSDGLPNQSTTSAYSADE